MRSRPFRVYPVGTNRPLTRKIAGSGLDTIARRITTMAHETGAGVLRTLSSELASVVANVAPSVVRVDDGSRLTATGIIWSADGVIVTTSHGVERDEDLAIERADGTALPAALVGRDPDT